MPIIKRHHHNIPSSEPHGTEPRSTTQQPEFDYVENPTVREVSKNKSWMVFLVTAVIGLMLPFAQFYIAKFANTHDEFDAQQMNLVLESIEKLGALKQIAQAEMQSNTLFLEQAKEVGTQATIDAYDAILHKNRTEINEYRTRLQTSVLNLIGLYQSNEARSLHVLDQSISDAQLSSSLGKEKVLTSVKVIITNLPPNQTDWPSYISDSLDEQL